MIAYDSSDDKALISEGLEDYQTMEEAMNFDAFEAMNKDSAGSYEYINGRVYLLSSPGVMHQRIVSRMHVAVDDYLKQSSCDVFTTPFEITIKDSNENKNVVQPDLMILCDWQKDIDPNDRYKGIPKLVVEVLSQGNSKKEMITKLNLYMTSGIEEYWILDPYENQILVYHFKDKKVMDTGVYGPDQKARSFILKDFYFA
jgi:Uma2 family endonuclease